MLEAWFLQDFWTESGMFKSFIFFTYFSTQMKFLTALHRFLIISCYLFFITFYSFPTFPFFDFTATNDERDWKALTDSRPFYMKNQIGRNAESWRSESVHLFSEKWSNWWWLWGEIEEKMRRKSVEARSWAWWKWENVRTTGGYFSSYILFFSGDQHPRSISSFLLSPSLFFLSYSFFFFELNLEHQDNSLSLLRILFENAAH